MSDILSAVLADLRRSYLVDNGRYRAENLDDEGLRFFMAGDIRRSPDEAERQECVLTKSIVQLLEHVL